MKTVKKNWYERLQLYLKVFIIKNKPVDRRDWIRVSVLAIAVPVFLYSAGQLAFKLFTYIYEDYKHNQVIDQLPDNKDPFDNLDNVTPFPDSDFPYQVVYGTDSFLNDSGVLVEYEELRKRNNDMVGWIRMPGFARRPINYPIMYSGDNDYYVYRDFDRNSSYSGSIFLDGANIPYPINPLQVDRNLVIYGHAMKNLSMFGNLTDYFKNQKAWETARYIYIDLMNTRLEYEVVSTFMTTAHFNYRQIRFSNDTQYIKYIDDMIAKSVHDFNAPPITAKDKFVTLSTCYKTTQRTAVIGRLVRQIIYLPDPDHSDPNITPIPLPSGIPMNEPSPTPVLSPTPTPEISVTPGASPTGAAPTQGPEITPTVAPKPEPVNLIPNPDFEQEDISQWTANGVVAQRNDDLFHSGAYSMLVDQRQNAASSVSIDLTEILLSSGSGRYSFEAMMRLSEREPEDEREYLSKIRLRLTMKDATVIEYGTEDIPVTDTDWTLVGGKNINLRRIDPDDASSGEDSTGSSASQSASSDTSAMEASAASAQSSGSSSDSSDSSASSDSSVSSSGETDQTDLSEIIEFTQETLESAVLYISIDSELSFYLDDVFFGKEVQEQEPSDGNSSQGDESSAVSESQTDTSTSEASDDASQNNSSATSTSQMRVPIFIDWNQEKRSV